MSNELREKIKRRNRALRRAQKCRNSKSRTQTDPNTIQMKPNTIQRCCEVLRFLTTLRRAKAFFLMYVHFALWLAVCLYRTLISPTESSDGGLTFFTTVESRENDAPNESSPGSCIHSNPSPYWYALTTTYTRIA